MRILVAGVALVVACSMTSCVSRTAYMAQANRARGALDTLEQLQQYLEQFEQENASLKAENAKFKRTAEEAAWVRAQKEKLARLLADFEKQGGQQQKGVKFFTPTSGGLGIRIDDEVLFSPGKAVVSDTGKTTLRGLISILKKHSKTIRVDGHTDDDPIRVSKWLSNLHLSAARSLAVAEVLNGFGIGWEKLLIAGYGPTRPVSKVPGDKARNRRVELFLQ